MGAISSHVWNSYRKKRVDFKTRHANFEEECKHAGRDLRDLTISMVTDGMVGPSRSKVEKLTEAAAWERGETKERYAVLNSVITGNNQEAAKRVKNFQMAGVHHLILNFPSLELIDQLEYFGAEVIPQFI